MAHGVHLLLPPEPPAVTPRDPVTFVARFRGAGWRYPWRPGDGLEVWHGTTRLGLIPAELVIDVLQQYVLGARLTERVQAALVAEALAIVDVPPLDPAPAVPQSDTPVTPMVTTPMPRLRGATGRRLRGRKEAPDAQGPMDRRGGSPRAGRLRRR